MRQKFQSVKNLISRREFLGTAAGAAAIVPASFQKGLGDRVANAAAQELDCVMLDMGQDCALEESRRGFQSALESAGARFGRIGQSEVGSSVLGRVVVVPACVGISPPIANFIATRLGRGALVVIESGAGFASPAEFRAQQRFLKSSFGLLVDRPVDLWEAGATQPRVPYVDYFWPARVTVRDFSRVVPVREPAGRIIARIEGMPVATRLRVGKGTLVFLGSPVGPVLFSGDCEACGWFGRLMSVV